MFIELRRSYIRGPKSFDQNVLGTFALFDELAESRALLWMKKKKKKMDDGVAICSSLASGGICLFVDLWEAKPCPGGPRIG